MPEIIPRSAATNYPKMTYLKAARLCGFIFFANYLDNSKG